MAPGAQHVLQAGLASGMSAVSGIHSSKPTKPPSDFDGLAHLLPQSFVPTAESKVTLKGAKGDDVKVPYMAIGAWPWGDTATFHWDPKERPAVTEAWKALLAAGLNWIDTAQGYGTDGESERICGELFEGMRREDFVIQTKWFPVPNLTNVLSPTHAPAKMLRASLERMRLDFVDVYLVHGHIHASSIAQVAKGLAECVEEGMARAVGVANYDEGDMIKMADELAKYDIPLATNQCEYSVLRRHPETHGLLKACRDRGIVFQSYSSLAQGRLTGKYGVGNEPPDSYRFSSYPMKEVEPVLEVLREIAQRAGVSVAAVALNYNISKGVVPVVGMRKPEQVKQNAEAFGWRLTDEDVRKIDKVSFEGKATKLWQQG